MLWYQRTGCCKEMDMPIDDDYEKIKNEIISEQVVSGGVKM